ncbi:unnamed protein product [Plutella xylostella]|uniref:(diamondback moth) hypothetical protein n=1 Tax=Plutella xylostella TaxID=51655 RepID=A0A8S4FPP2_PLUXY|nr:unnamed protein product [Plutella xylostella]
MSDYPDPDEEYELMYADEYELMRETEENLEPNTVRKKSIQAKRSLDFTSPAAPRPSIQSQADTIIENGTNDQLPLTPSLEPVENILTPVTSHKRTVDDLFGDINDIDFDEVALPSKRQKTDEEKDEELIDKIIAGRKLKQILLEPTGRAQVKGSSYVAKDNISLDIPRWSFLPLTNSDGDRVYVKLEPEDVWEKSLDVVADMGSLHATYASVWEEARKILEKKQEDEEKQSSQQSQPLPNADLSSYGSKLWVEKYKPACYVDLLSDEPVNRALLHWLHLWDKVVFKKEVKLAEPTQRSKFSARAGQFHMSSNWRGKKEEQPEMDDDGRPHHKVALLCGPPGVGKTTLAHLLARIAGYRPVELNASDERSVDAFRTALQSATLMRSVIDQEKRPNCLILDEIDGAPLPTVELLVKWCTATSSDNKKKAKSQPLRRPVIAICNDLYATALRPLRAIAHIIHVQGVTHSRLLSRISLVASEEGLELPPRVLGDIARRAAGDVRAAILVLSFVKAKGLHKAEDIMKVNIGEKDCNKSLIQALQTIFVANDQPDAEKKCHQTISANGEYDRIIDGIFENYLQSRVDSRLLIACETLSWLREYDVISAWTMKHQNYSLYGRLPLCAAACRRVLASRNQLRIKYPMQAQEMSRKRQELESILSSVYSSRLPAVSGARRALLLDIIPLLPRVLAPSLRNPNLCTEVERELVRSAARAMCDYGLQHTPRRTADGLYETAMEPDIYRLAFFGNEDAARPPPAVRQAIAREQQLEMIRRAEAMSKNMTCSQVDRSKKEEASKPQPPRLPNHLQRLKPKEVERVAPQVHKDFFGRIVPIVESSQRTGAARDLISSSSVFYQYREGFNNAVRRSVKMIDLL